MVLGETFPPDIRVEKEASALLAGGHDVTLLCRRTDGRHEREHVNGIDIVRLFGDSWIQQIARFGSAAVNLLTGVHPAWAVALNRLVQTKSIDVIHIHDLPLVRTGLLVGRRHGIPVVADLHENYPEAIRQWRKPHQRTDTMRNPAMLLHKLFMPVSRYKRFEQRLLPRVDRLITVSEEAAVHYRYDCEVDPDHITVASNTVDLDVFDVDIAPIAEYDDEFVIAYIGSFSGPHRGLETAVTAFGKFVDHVPNARLLLVGSGSDIYEDRLRQRARECGVSDHMTMTGWVDFGQVPSYIAAADICLVPHAETPHTRTTIPHKLFQYMAMAKPVIVTNMPSLERVVSQTQAGLVVPAGDSTMMAEAFNSLYDNPCYAKNCGLNGRVAVEEQYNWERDAERLRDLYSELN